MPWAPRSTLPPATDTCLSSNASDSSDSTGSHDDMVSMTGYASPFALPTQTASNQALFEQLAASHAAQQALATQVRTLQRELDQSRKREEALKAVFYREFTKERELFLEDKLLNAKAECLKEKSEKVRKAMRALEEKELEIEVSIALRKGEEGFNEDPYDSWSFCDPVFDDPVTIRAPDHTYPFSYGNTTLLGLNNVKNCCTIINGKDRRFGLLRRHDYYNGWLDAMRALDHQKAIALENRCVSYETRDPVLNKSTHYLCDLNHPKNPRNAGVNVGLLFAYSALCKKHNLSQRDRRLDVREWDLSSLKPLGREDQFGEFDFWYGVDYAVDKMTRLFEMKIEKGVWGTSDDAEQMALLKTADMKRGYDIMPGRKLIEEHALYVGLRKARMKSRTAED